MSIHRSTFNLGVCIRLHLNKHVIINLNLLDVPVYERHTDTMIFTTASKVLDVYVRCGKTLSSEFQQVVIII